MPWLCVVDKNISFLDAEEMGFFSSFIAQLFFADFLVRRMNDYFNFHRNWAWLFMFVMSFINFGKVFWARTMVVFLKNIWWLKEVLPIHVLRNFDAIAICSCDWQWGLNTWIEKWPTNIGCNNCLCLKLKQLDKFTRYQWNHIKKLAMHNITSHMCSKTVADGHLRKVANDRLSKVADICSTEMSDSLSLKT